MAHVHEQLQLSDTVASFDLAGYVARLCEDTSRRTRLRDQRAVQFVEFCCSAPSLMLFEGLRPKFTVPTSAFCQDVRPANCGKLQRRKLPDSAPSQRHLERREGDEPASALVRE
jgi:hypothetical protein